MKSSIMENIPQQIYPIISNKVWDKVRFIINVRMFNNITNEVWVHVQNKLVFNIMSMTNNHKENNIKL
jgi:hypothetical protein